MPENLPHSFSTQTYFFLLWIFIHMLPFSCQVKTSSPDVWLISTTAPMPLFTRLMNKTCGLKVYVICQFQSVTHYVSLAGMSVACLPWWPWGLHKWNKSQMSLLQFIYYIMKSTWCTSILSVYCKHTTLLKNWTFGTYRFPTNSPHLNKIFHSQFFTHVTTAISFFYP